MNVQKMRYRTKRAREEVYHERKMKSLNQVSLLLGFEKYLMIFTVDMQQFTNTTIKFR